MPFTTGTVGAFRVPGGHYRDTKRPTGRGELALDRGDDSRKDEHSEEESDEKREVEVLSHLA